MLISTFETIFLLSSPICQQMILLCHIYFLGNIPSDGVVLLADDALSHVCDFPTSFHLPSRRSIRRRLLTQSAGIIFVVLIIFFRSNCLPCCFPNVWHFFPFIMHNHHYQFNLPQSTFTYQFPMLLS